MNVAEQDAAFASTGNSNMVVLSDHESVTDSAADATHKRPIKIPPPLCPPQSISDNENDEESKLWAEMGAVHQKSTAGHVKKRNRKKLPRPLKTLFGRGKNESRYAPIKYSPVSPVRDEHFENIIGDNHFENMIGSDQQTLPENQSPPGQRLEDVWIRDLDRFFKRLYELYINQVF